MIVPNRIRTGIARAATLLLLCGAMLLVGPATALAEGRVEASYSDPAPTILGPYLMTPFGPDPRPAGGTWVSSVPGPTGNILFSQPARHLMVSDLGVWGHEYTGDVYAFFANGTGATGAATVPNRLTITLPPNTMAFYLYRLSGSALPYGIQALSASGEEIPCTVQAIDASFYGVYSLGQPIERLVLWLEAAGGALPQDAPALIIGQFAINGIPSANASPRADVAAVIYGGWSGMPVQASVGGTAQPVQYTAPDASGEAATLFTFWPGETDAWQVAVTPQLPAELDPEEWEIVLVGVRQGGIWSEASGASSITIQRGSQIVFYYQLMHKSAG